MEPLHKESTKKFYQSAYGIQRVQSRSPGKQKTQVALRQDGILNKSNSSPGKFLSMSQIQRHEQGDHTFRNVLLFLLFAGIFIFGVDLYKEIEQEKVELQIKRKKCHDEYMLNECQNAFDAIKAKCHQLEMCFKHDVNMTLRTSQTAVKLIGKLVNVFLKETGWVGAVLVVSLMIIMLSFIYKASRSAMTHQRSIKRE